MKIVDLTHPISPNMPVYPGTKPPVITTGCSIDETGFLEKIITFYSHTGTHIDAPAHLIKDHNTLDMLAIEHFYGPALMLNFDHCAIQTIGVKELEPYHESIMDIEFLLLHTGWSRYWGTENYFSNYPVLSIEAAQWVNSFGLKGFGLDTISADTGDTQDYQIHKALLQNNTIIIENLTNLSDLPLNQFAFSCFPLSFQQADGSPVRAVAYIQDF
ncbi:MAG: cyclase family protein [Desulforhopalus sp.]